ncbi:MAG: hypothetical protein IT379_18935 [Deltaproteobacteria bacterium]|nr:hypothetical protein [Deltaproteobacteria bacterium]
MSAASARTHVTTGLGLLEGGIYDELRGLGVLGLDAELRHYRPRIWVFGTRVYFGGGLFADVGGSRTDGSVRTAPIFGLWVATLLGVHFTRESESDNAGYSGSSVGETVRCDYRYRRRLYASYVLGVEPVLWVVEEIGGGVHAVWELDVYGDGRLGRYEHTGQQVTRTDYRLRTGAKLGYISLLGVGGHVFGQASWGSLDLQLGLGVYVNRGGPSLFMSGTVGIFWR